MGERKRAYITDISTRIEAEFTGRRIEHISPWKLALIIGADYPTLIGAVQSRSDEEQALLVTNERNKLDRLSAGRVARWVIEFRQGNSSAK